MGTTKPASPRVVWVGPSDHELITEAITLGDQNSRTLGFMPHEVYKQAAAAGTLVALVSDDKVIAYALYSLPRRSIKLKHLCISKKFRKHGFARLLVENIGERHGDRTGISLHCRTDYPENKMWPHLGFKRTGTKTGRGYERMELTAWWLDHGHPDLFSTNDSFGPLRVMIDLNVFADIESTFKRAEYEESGALTDITLIDQVELVISSEMSVEIRRLPSESEKAHQLKAARKYSVVRNDPRTIDRTAARFTALVAAAGGPDLNSSPAQLLSVRPQFAESILDGSKTAEIRRQRPDVRSGTLVIIYATKPKGAIVGTARVSSMSQGTPGEIWERHKAHVGISREEFDSYLDGAVVAYALLLKRVQRLVPFLTLEEMRAAAAFQPPQSYRYVNQEMLDSLVSGHPESASLLSMLQS